MITLAMVIMCVVAIAVSRRPMPLAAADAAYVPSDRLHELPEVTPEPAAVVPATAVAVAPAVTPPSVRESSAKPASVKAQKARIAEAPSPAAAVAAIDDALAGNDFPTAVPAFGTLGADLATESPEPPAPGGVTVIGCLENSGKNQFRLTNTEGAEAPRSRNWRSGFLRKRSTAVTLVEPPDPSALQAQVGHRISATGQLSARDLRVTSVQVIGTRCD